MRHTPRSDSRCAQATPRRSFARQARPRTKARVVPWRVAWSLGRLTTFRFAAAAPRGRRPRAWHPVGVRCRTGPPEPRVNAANPLSSRRLRPRPQDATGRGFREEIALRRNPCRFLLAGGSGGHLVTCASFPRVDSSTVEQRPFKSLVPGSNPGRPTIFPINATPRRSRQNSAAGVPPVRYRGDSLKDFAKFFAEMPIDHLAKSGDFT